MKQLDFKRSFILLAIVLLHGCIQDRSCEDVRAAISDANNRALLEVWVDERFRRWVSEGSPTLEGKIKWPGYFGMQLDMSGLPLPEVRNTYEARAGIDSDENVRSVFIGFENFKGVIVALDDKNDAGSLLVNPHSIEWVSNRVGYMCLKRG